MKNITLQSIREDPQVQFELRRLMLEYLMERKVFEKLYDLEFENAALRARLRNLGNTLQDSEPTEKFENEERNS